MTLFSDLLGTIAPTGATGAIGLTGATGVVGLSGVIGLAVTGSAGVQGATGSGGPQITSITIADASYNVLDDTAANTGGGYIVITGTNFVSGATVLIDNSYTSPANTASAVTFVNSTTLRAQVPAKAAASYNVWVVNPDGSIGIKVNGLTYSGTPTWVTTSPLANVTSNVAFSVAFSATGANTYSVANGSTIPAGTTLAANGYFSGTVSISTQTDYTFSIRATDGELQDADKTFAVTVTVPPVTYGGLWTWGSNASGNLGLNDKIYRSSPVQVGSGTTWNEISSGTESILAIKTDGTAWVWGASDSGQLGLNDATIYGRRSSPTQLGTLTNWSKASVGRLSMKAIKTDGTLWSWGGNARGQLGLSTATTGFGYRSSPSQVGTDTNWYLLAGRYLHALSTKTNGTLWLWGDNSYGQLGLNDRVARSSPIQLGTDTWSKISGDNSVSCAIKTNGTLWLWGGNFYGQLAQNDQVYRSSPVQVGTDTNWSTVDNNGGRIMAIKTNGTLWALGGRNQNGQLGLNDRIYRSSPVQVGALTNWSSVSMRSLSTFALKTDGTLWAWGRGSDGELGLSINTSRSSPVQIGSGTNWSVLSAGGFCAVIGRVV